MGSSHKAIAGMRKSRGHFNRAAGKRMPDTSWYREVARQKVEEEDVQTELVVKMITMMWL